MMEAIGARAAALPEALRRQLPTEAQTVHRLLGAGGRGGDFRHHAANRLPIDILVVDEASMLDLALATQLLEAVPDEARIVLLGDKDQLAAVEAGSVFAEVSADPSLDAPTRRALAPLAAVAAEALRPPEATETHRFAGDSGIAALAAAVRAGDAAQAGALLQGDADGALRWLHDDAALAAHVRAGYAPFVEAVCTRAADTAAVMRTFDAFRVLCAVRGGPRGVAALNRACEQVMRAAVAEAGALPPPLGPGPGAATWYLGRPVMVTRNDHGLKLFNGDVGIALPDARGSDGPLRVHFPGPGGTFRAIAPARLPEHETAFATTVHKSQGSEFDRVVVVLPAQPSAVLTRELLYTAVTRARGQVALAASPQMLQLAVTTPTRRHSGLLARLHEAAKAGPPA
jgi:exodeoxyribonuclease V alpha subunit